MSTITYSDARKNFKKVLDQVHENSEAIVILRKNSENAVIMSEQEYESLMETIYLLRSPKNAERLLDSIKQVENNETKERKLINE
ncbi:MULTISPECIES: type II toxin-antitoxin system Phd/YefM family antitoxin [Exiguobacterium]|uniref:type II toxin-antitoxin system Phd/YefM family antitoxin n=1 Tax=Exiguobacterium TaxID=33986 RepID=UPI0025BD19A9|nr:MULTISPECIES: type II toxin-antitoxin system prevent-host-death family antitoxin [Exiguobacterium]